VSRFYSNENFPLPVVEELRKLGHDVLTIQETGKADEACPDKEVRRLREALACSPDRQKVHAAAFEFRKLS
jgi:hypothetical protein